MKVPLSGGPAVTLGTRVSNDPFAVGPQGVYAYGYVNGTTTLTLVRVPAKRWHAGSAGATGGNSADRRILWNCGGRHERLLDQFHRTHVWS